MSAPKNLPKNVQEKAGPETRRRPKGEEKTELQFISACAARRYPGAFHLDARHGGFFEIRQQDLGSFPHATETTKCGQLAPPTGSIFLNIWESWHAPKSHHTTEKSFFLDTPNCANTIAFCSLSGSGVAPHICFARAQGGYGVIFV